MNIHRGNSSRDTTATTVSTLTNNKSFDKTDNSRDMTTPDSTHPTNKSGNTVTTTTMISNEIITTGPTDTTDKSSVKTTTTTLVPKFQSPDSIKTTTTVPIIPK